jgi:K+/H+ antiporter YhaU regulatory subunit KhtT
LPSSPGRHAPAAQTQPCQRNRRAPPDFRSQYRLQEHLFQIKIPDGSALVGKTLAKSRLGAALGLTVVGITRSGATLLAPPSPK